MEIIKSELAQLINKAGTHVSAEARERYLRMLNSSIQAYGMTQRVDALNVQRKVFANRGLVAVDAAELAKLEARMQALVSSSSDALYDIDIEWLKAGVPKPSSYMAPREADSEPAGPEFTVPDPDLDALLNDTAALLSGNANMDVGISWAESLRRVMDRLNEQGQQATDESDSTERHFTSYRVHVVLDKAVGRPVLSRFKTEGHLLGACLPSVPSLASEFFKRMEEEFGIKFSEEAIAAMRGMNNEELVAYIHRIPNKRRPGK